MLLEISIKNYVIIEHETIAFTSGLNVITGETGAGKSLVIDAIDAVTGGKLSKDDIRHGAQKAVIEALFSLDEGSLHRQLLAEYGIELEEDNTLLISREVNASGKSVSRINGQIVTLSMLRSIAESIIDIVGQNEHQLLLNTSRHMEFVDNYNGIAVQRHKDELKRIIEQIKGVEKKLEDICGNPSERERRLDLLKFQIEEIKAAKLKLNEEVELKDRRTLLTNAEKLFKSINFAYQKVFSSESSAAAVVDILNNCADCLSDASSIDPSLAALKSVFEGVVYQLEDIKPELRNYRDNIEFNDKEIDSIEERLDAISKLKRKYGATVQEILDFCSSASIQYEELKNSEKLADDLGESLKQLRDGYLGEALKLSEERRKSSAQLEKLVEKELQDLNMLGARFVIRHDKDKDALSSKGIDKIEFMISPNPGEPEKPLSRIASGGEMSRIMLAIKNALSNIEGLGVLVFDEVDAGIGGITGTLIGQKIKAISKSVQTVCITHLPQIASFGDNHIYIAKSVENDKTWTHIKVLDKEQKVIEIARMMGGDIDSKSSIQHAKDLIKNSK